MSNASAGDRWTALATAPALPSPSKNQRRLTGAWSDPWSFIARLPGRIRLLVRPVEPDRMTLGPARRQARLLLTPIEAGFRFLLTIEAGSPIAAFWVFWRELRRRRARCGSRRASSRRSSGAAG